LQIAFLYGKGHLRSLLGPLFLEWRSSPDGGVKCHVIGLAIGGTRLYIPPVFALGMGP
jgi:hypothetical protein